MARGTQVQGERRSAERFTLALPVETDKGPGVTRDLSLSGLYLLTEERLVVGERLHLAVTLSDGGRSFPFRLALEGSVVRVEEAGAALGAGITLDEKSTRLRRAS